MSHLRRHLSALPLLTLAAALSLPAAPAAAQSDFPNKPVRLIVPFPPGGVTDIVARAVAVKLAGEWGQQVIVDNKPGASGAIGAELGAKAAPDGYTLIMGNISTLAINAVTFAKLPYDPITSFEPIGMVAIQPLLVAVHPSVPAKTLAEFVQLARNQPGQISYGTAGSSIHLAVEQFSSAAGMKLNHVPYKGSSPAIADLVGGQIQFVTPNLSAAIAFVNTGKLRALAVTSKERSAQLPNVPAVAETLPGFENLGWFGFMVPTGAPKAVIAKVHADTVKALAGADLRKRITEIGMVTVGNTPEEFTKDIKVESERWAKIIMERNLQVK